MTAAGRNTPPLPGKSLMKQPQVTPLSHLLSVYGVSGLTAYFGLTEVGQAEGR